jgi:uncharacterized protein YbjT (DUF2867 family)
MERTNKKVIAVVGAAGQQRGAVVRALQANKQFKVRALTRKPDEHPQLGDEIIKFHVYHNLIGVLAPQKQTDGSASWALPRAGGQRSCRRGLEEISRLQRTLSQQHAD